KVGHGINRIIALGHSGTITLEALRWMNRVGITFTQLDTDGRTLTASAGMSLNDARLRRAQVAAANTETGLNIVKALLDAKLSGQARVAAEQLDAVEAADEIEERRRKVSEVETVDQ